MAHPRAVNVAITTSATSPPSRDGVGGEIDSEAGLAILAHRGPEQYVAAVVDIPSEVVTDLDLIEAESGVEGIERGVVLVEDLDVDVVDGTTDLLTS